ncbi:MAG: [protein-PII] uridylyltransferase [Gallionella sp.]|nr:[protein-PII] uridylyltransferase [Gallionella sp.]
MTPLALPEVNALRAALRQDRLALEQTFLVSGHAPRLLRSHSNLVDQYLRQIWQQLAMPQSLALIAVGGYGRGELYPKSDIDLLILLDDDPDEVLQSQLQQLIGVLWDIGMEVGHSIRTIAQCISESSDITVQTNLLEGRLLAGNAKLFKALNQSIQRNLDPCAFFTAKLQEQQQRHARFAEADFNLEPNLKESPGGLRDLQTITWISRAAGLGTRWKDLAQQGLMTFSEARLLNRHDSLLQMLRIRLHYLAKRREDRLLFDFQTQLAEQMDIVASDNRRASEHLMQRYYQTRRVVRQFNTILLQNLRDHLFDHCLLPHNLNDRFRSVGTLLEIRDEHLFEHTPAAIFELFSLMQQHPELTDLSAMTLRALWRAQQHIDNNFRRNPAHRAKFMAILRESNGLTHALRRMNQYGILGAYLPVFRRIVGQMQHDLFHVYTVDEHILMVVRNLRRFEIAEHAHEVPLCNKLMAKFARPYVLYIAGLFHDIAKGRGGDHAELGKKDARLFCTHHKLSRDDTDLIVWLVGEHLTLSATAQKQDLSDPDVIAKFGNKIKNDRYLVALFLLTVADVRGTSPKVWNAWKGKLMEDLFWATRRYLSDGKFSNRLDEVRKQADAVLAESYHLRHDAYTLLWAQLDDNYFIDHEAHEIAWHTYLLADKVNIVTPVVKTRLSLVGEGLQVLVYCQDQRGLFARTCDFFARMHYSIVEAKMHTTQHGYALGSFQVIETQRADVNYANEMNYIDQELTEHIAHEKPIVLASSGRLSRQVKHFPINTKVNIEKTSHGLYMLTLVTGDRPGLLARIPQILNKYNVLLHRAKINTLGLRAEDVFWISGDTLNNPEQTRLLLSELLEKI